MAIRDNQKLHTFDQISDNYLLILYKKKLFTNINNIKKRVQDYTFIKDLLILFIIKIKLARFLS